MCNSQPYDRTYSRSIKDHIKEAERISLAAKRWVPEAM